MADEKVLRIGVIQGVAVIEERLVRAQGPISFGTASQNTFVLQGSDLPKSVTLFEQKGDGYQIVFSDSTVGRLETNAAKNELAQLKGSAEKTGDSYRITLDDSARGRIKLSDEITVLFHFVPAPPVATTTALPADLRSNVLNALEPVFTAVMLASFLLHSAIAIFVKVVEPPAPADSLEDLRKVVETLAPPPKVEVPKVNTPVDTTVTTGPGKSDDEPQPKSGGGSGGDSGGGGGKKGKGGGGGGVGDRAALREQIAGRGILQLIGGRGGDGAGGGAVGSVFGAGSSISDDIGSALQGTAGVGVAGAGGGSGVTRRGTGGDGTGGDGTGGGIGGGAADIGVLQTGGGGKVDTGQKSAARIVARVRADDVEAVDGKIDRKVVKATLQRRADAFQACYEQALKANSKLQGKLVVEFTIGDAGKVTEARVVKDGLGSGAVNQCVLDVLRRLRFPAPDDGEVTISNTFVFQPGS